MHRPIFNDQDQVGFPDIEDYVIMTTEDISNDTTYDILENTYYDEEQYSEIEKKDRMLWQYFKLWRCHIGDHQYLWSEEKIVWVSRMVDSVFSVVHMVSTMSSGKGVCVQCRALCGFCVRINQKFT